MQKKRLKIFVAGPYSPIRGSLHDAARTANHNTLRAIQAGISLMQKGHYPFIPHLTHFIHIQSDRAFSKAVYRKYDIIWLKHCDALYFIGPSEGANRELRFAQKHKLRIFRSLWEVPDLKGTKK